MNHLIEWVRLSAGNHRLNCPACGREHRQDKTLGVTLDAAGAGVAHCFRCNYVETFRPAKAGKPQAQRNEPAQSQAKVEQGSILSAYGRTLWAMAHLIEPGTPAAAYLQLRRCALPPASGHLRWLPAYRHPSGHIGPCMVALLTDAETGTDRSLHFTWIDGGRKADVTPPRLLLKGHRKAGTVCRLHPKGHALQGLGIAEGIETALSLAHGLTPVWACIDAGNLAAFPVLPNTPRLIIGRDRDPAGERAAASCAGRWAAAGRQVLVTRQDANDLNDVLRALGDAA